MNFGGTSKTFMAGRGALAFRSDWTSYPTLGATIEIAELSSGTVVLPERVVEFSIAPAVRIEAEMREALSSVRDCLDRLNANFPKEEKNRWKIPFSTALRSPRAGIADTNAVEIREELTKMGKSLSNLEKELPQFWNKQSWALSYFNVVRALLQLVIDPPKVHEPATSSLLIIHDAAEPDATAATLASVLGQTLKPRDIFLIAPADALLDFAPSSAALEVVRLEPDQLPMDAANSVAARTNGSHLLILDAGVVLVPEALAWLAAAIEQTGGSIIYTDGEITAPDEGGSERLLPLFRPAFDYDLLLQRNYIGKAFCIERQTYMALGGFSCDPMVDPYHDFLLRAVIRCGRGAFIHLPLLLVSVRPSVSSGGLGTERERTLRTVQAHLDRLGTGAQAVAHADPFGRSLPDAAKIQWPEGSVGRVSVIIPTRDRADMVFALISSLRRHAAAWDRVEIIVVVNGKLDPQSEFAFSEIGKVFDQVQILYRQIPFNWGEINNLAVDESCTGETIVFLNDDIVCLTDSWDDRLRSQLRRPEIGAVGGRLLYPNGVIQHAGITFCGDGVTAHEAMGDLASEGLYLDRTLLVHEIAAVTGAFLACRRTLFDQLQGFDAERYTITSSDADFCVRVRATGASVIYDPFLTWIHYESITRGRDSHDYKKHWRAEAEQEAWRSNFLEIDLVDLGLNPHLVCFARPFEVFHRPSQEGIGLWLQAQLRRREQWSEAACRVPS
jgi:GT2 family glycosyltransferase